MCEAQHESVVHVQARVEWHATESFRKLRGARPRRPPS
jgi:hypothetical protein